MQIVLSLRSSQILARLLCQPELLHSQTFERDVLERIRHDQLMTVPGIGTAKADRVLQEIGLALAAQDDGRVSPLASADLHQQVCVELLKHDQNAVQILKTLPLSLEYLSDDLVRVVSLLASEDGRETPMFVDVVAIHTDLLRLLKMFSEGTIKKLIREVSKNFQSLLGLIDVGAMSREEVLFAAFLDMSSKNEVSFQQFENLSGLSQLEIHQVAESAQKHWKSFLSHDAHNLCKSLQFSCEYLAGTSLRVIGETHGCSSENIRRRLIRVGVSPSKLRADRQEKINDEVRRIRRISRALRPEIFEYLKEYPGSTRNEICEYFQIDSGLLEETLGGRVALVLDEKFLAGIDESQFVSSDRTRAAAIQALREASEIIVDLTGPKYDDLLHKGIIEGPSSARIHQVFESWKEACLLAGVEPGRRGRSYYARQWSEEELLEVLFQYLHETEGAGTIEDYSVWREECGPSELPSPGTIQNHISRSWLVIRAKALLALRSQWDVSLG